MNNQHTITKDDISKIVEFVSEYFSHDSRNPNIEELIGMHLENTAADAVLSHPLEAYGERHVNSASSISSERLYDAHAWMASQYLEVINDRRRLHNIQPSDKPKHSGSKAGA